jgi:hypothetical protein
MKFAFFEVKKFSVINVGRSQLQIGNFVRRHRRWHMESVNVFDIDEKSPVSAWQEAFSSLNADGRMLILTGEIPGGIFLQYESAKMPLAEQHGALLFELPRHLLKVPEDVIVQFVPTAAAEDGKVNVNAYAFAKKSLEKVQGIMSQVNAKVDVFCYPLLGLRAGDPPVFLADGNNNEYYFANGSWQRIADESVREDACRKWMEIFSQSIEIPEDIHLNGSKWLGVMLTAMMAIRGEIKEYRSSIAVLPGEFRLVRYRMHLVLTAVLAALLVVGGAWKIMQPKLKNIAQTKAIKKEIAELKRNTTTIQNQLKRSAKSLKEKGKIVSEYYVCDTSVMNDFTTISQVLPKSVMISSLRFGYHSIDIVMNSEDANLDIPAIFKPLHKWKIEQLQQQRGSGNSVTTVTVKLVHESDQAEEIFAGKGRKK